MQRAFKYLLSAFRHRYVYQTSLPYNLNWQISFNQWERGFLEKNPLTVCDVGARGGAPTELDPFWKFMVYQAFDADMEECARLNSMVHPYKEYQAMPYFVGGPVQRKKFNLFVEREDSSAYEPGKRYGSFFGGENYKVEKTLSIDTTTLDSIYSKEKLKLPDFVKLDTQGNELEILQGAKKVIENASLVEVEVEFFELYEGQPLFHDVMGFMLKNGFDLLYINRFFSQRGQIFQGAARGQLIFGDALFGRREDCLGHLSKENLIKYILLLINYGHIDFAFHLAKIFPELEYPVARFKSSFYSYTAISKIGRMSVSLLDKMILFLLFLRKYNQLQYDTDRSWPIR